MDLKQSEDQRVAQTLRHAGFQVSSVYDLVNSSDPYPAAVPILLDILPTVRDQTIREGVIRALTVPEARGLAAPALIGEFEREDSPELVNWVIASALSVVADAAVFDQLIRLVTDRRFGSARQMLTIALVRAGGPKAEDVLIQLLDDEDVAGHALYALRTIATEKSTPRLKTFLSHPRMWVRREAEKTLAHIQKRSKRKA